MSYTNKSSQPSSYQPQSWPPRPHARFAHIPQGLSVLARITSWQDPALVVATPEPVVEPVIAKPLVITAPIIEAPAVPTPVVVVTPAAEAPAQEVLLPETLPSIAISSIETTPAEWIAAEELPETTAFFEQELNQPVVVEAETVQDVEPESFVEPNEITSHLGQAPQYQPAIREAVQRRAKALRAKKTLVTQWHLAGNATVLNRLPSLHLWAMAGCWGQLREEKLVVIDATSSGPELAQLLGWDCATGWSDLLTERAALSETLHNTPWPNVTLIPRGSCVPEFYDETCLRQASALGALQREYRAVWILTAGTWDIAAQVTSQHVGERQLIVPLNCPASEWRDLNARLVAGNVLVNGWVALNSATSATQRRAA
jgi:hypothetical protein